MSTDTSLSRADHIRNAMNGIAKGFPWQETDEGPAFWGNVYDLLLDRLNAELAKQHDKAIEQILRTPSVRVMSPEELATFDNLFNRPALITSGNTAAKNSSCISRFMNWFRQIFRN